MRNNNSEVKYFILGSVLLIFVLTILTLNALLPNNKQQPGNQKPLSLISGEILSVPPLFPELTWSKVPDNHVVLGSRAISYDNLKIGEELKAGDIVLKGKEWV